jgi:ATP-dependent DNA helicase RecG
MDGTNSSSTSPLQTPLQFLKGVGPERARLLGRLQLRTARDLLFFFPRDYVDLSERRTIAELQADVPVSLVAVVQEVELRASPQGRSILGVLLRQDDQFCRAVWFNQPFMQQRFRPGQTVLIAGSAKLRGMRWEFVHPRVTFFEGESETPGEVLPVYSLTEGLRQHQVRRIVLGAVEEFVEHVPEVFPPEYLAAQGLASIQNALRDVHRPSCPARLQEARYRLVYQELLIMQLGMALRQQQLVQRSKAVPLEKSARIDSRIKRLFPFELTVDQVAVIDEIAADMGKSWPMNRLLQGDVGSGKTAVAAYAMLLAVAHGAQAVLMAPTEILARQHHQTLSAMLAKSQVRLRFLSGSTTARQRETLEAELKEGQADILVGTQAVISRELAFHRLALVIIDEQHKFGVMQRALLRQGDTDPHFLVMTATPIPRTVAMTQFGDLEVSLLRGSPPGRQPVHTYVAEETQRARWWDFFRKKLREGQQGFVISHAVDREDEDDSPNAENLLENLSNGELADFRLDLLHGRMTSEQKIAAMQAFQEGKTQVLVSTSVVEVGVDVPNANLMTIEGGDRFGLSQLHQLRGRVGRGVFPGYVCVFSQAKSEEARHRLAAFAGTCDGFELAEVDFELRGPGELFGTRQHGLPPLMVADLRRDSDVLQRARADARALIAANPAFDDPAWARLRRMVIARYGASLELADVG